MSLIHFKFRIILTIGILSNFSSFSQSDQRLEIEQAALDIIQKAKYCALITIDDNGRPHARTMDPFLPEKDFVVWLATNPKSRKVTHIKNNPNVSMYYFEQSIPGYVTINGKAELVNEDHEKSNRWKEEWKDFYPDRKNSYILIKVIPNRLEVVNYTSKILGDTITWAAPALIIKN
ncbi:MAG: pyridoxamine 5'-phosphate oxidase family protein [Flammeovirgaceae bacterium]|nr:pyridoxamine 5'-phosphate oxidase family protein [Flammeovirgaceae bacterium]